MEMLELSGVEDATDSKLLIISPSELSTMRQCPLKHQLTYGERWSKQDRPESHALGFGTLWHDLMQGHYQAVQDLQTEAHQKRGKWWDIDLSQAEDEAAIAAFSVIESVEDPEVATLLSWMYDGHLRMWGLDPEWQIMAVEHGAEVALPGPKGFQGRFNFRIKVKMDLVVKHLGRIWVIDHKSCKNLPNNLDLDFDDQFGIYVWACRQMGLKVFGAIHNAAKKTRLKGDAEGTKITPLSDRFRRSPMSRGDIELDTIALEAWQTAYERYGTLYDLQRMREFGTRLDAPRAPDPSTCGWKCDWTEACIMGRKGSDMRQTIYLKGYRKDQSRH